MRHLLAADFQPAPYWWRAAPPRHVARPILAAHYDVAIIGSGFTGLRAALELSRGGARVIVIERDEAGSGASRRNAGFLGRSLKKTYPQLAAKRGEAFARRIYGELDASYQRMFSFVSEENIDCHAVRCGRLIGGTSPYHLASLVAEWSKTKEALGWDFRALDATEMRGEIASDAYYGGVVVPDQGSIHPGLYHEGLLDRVLSAGATLLTGCDVSGIERAARTFNVCFAGGEITADKVVVATNGYTPLHLKRFARRVIPFEGFMAATEELPEGVLETLIPHRRTVLDTNLNIDFFRPAPDSRRLLFGGSTGSRLQTDEALAVRMHALLTRIFPQLGEVRLSNLWRGKCAATFDMMPHIGEEDGLFYGMGYNFAGVPLGSYFGERIGRQILGTAGEASVFSEDPFVSAPFYNGNPWFVPSAMRYFDWQDRRLARRRV